jgi:hypothetical protein
MVPLHLIDDMPRYLCALSAISGELIFAYSYFLAETLKYLYLLFDESEAGTDPYPLAVGVQYRYPCLVVVKAGSKGKELFRRPLRHLKIMHLALLPARSQSSARPPFSHGP